MDQMEKLPVLRTSDDYTVGWVAVLSCEINAARLLLDHEHEDLESAPGDTNNYILGDMGNHNIVLAYPGAGRKGESAATYVATNMVRTFKKIRFGLLVGVAGGAPKPPDREDALRDIRLGDVIVSCPVDGYGGGVRQVDYGKRLTLEEFRLTDYLNKPPIILLAGVERLQTDHIFQKGKMHEYIRRAAERSVQLKMKGYTFPGWQKDQLFKASYHHPQLARGEEDLEPTCSECDASQTEIRLNRDSDYPAVHYGLIASGNQVVRSVEYRDQLRKKYRILCFEMEAAGLMDSFPCLVIRGICDYSDDHKNKAWQPYAATTAAAYAKDLLRVVQPQQVREQKFVVEVVAALRNIGEDIVTVIKEVETGVQENINDLRQEQRDRQLDQERDTILNWITPINYAPQQYGYINKRQLGTGQWLLNSEQFRRWLEARERTLFCQGDPGAGKTFLTSIVIDHLQAASKQTDSSQNTDTQDDKIGLAFVYCDIMKQDQQRPVDILASVLKQLIQDQPSIPQAVKNLYEKSKDIPPSSRSNAEIRNFSDVLQHVISNNYTRCFIVIDALDECHYIKDLLPEIFRVQDATKANLFATSRVERLIQGSFEGRRSLLLNIHATHEDVNLYIEGRIPDLDIFQEENRGLAEEIKTELKTKIKEKITGAVKGIFLLARFHLDSLAEKTTTNQISEELETLPKGPGAYDQAYGKIIKRIRTLPMPRRQLAKHILSFLTCAEKPLTTMELSHALAVKGGEPALNQGDVQYANIMVSVCMGLIIRERETDIISLLHHTTREYLRNNMGCLSVLEGPTAPEHVTIFDPKVNEIAWTKAQREAMIICVTYLSFSVFESGFCQTDGDFEKRLKSYPLYDYAALYWMHHARAASNIKDLMEWKSIRNFLLHEEKETMWLKRYAHLTNSFVPQPGMKWILHVAVYTGIIALVQEVLDIMPDVNVKDEYERTALHWAADNGDENIADLLVKSGANINAVDGVVRRFGASGYHLDPTRLHGLTPLQLAARNGHENVVQLLLKNNAVVNMESQVAHGRAVQIEEVMLAYRAFHADVGAAMTALQWAARNGHENVVQLLLNSNADVNMVGQMANSVAVQIEKLTIAYGSFHTDVGVVMTALQWAARNGHENIVQLLLNNNADVNMVGQMANSIAVQIKKLTIAHGSFYADVGASMTALQWAARNGHENIVQLLLNSNADANMMADTNGMALKIKEVEVHQGSFHGDVGAAMTALQWAARNGHENIVQLLLNSNADANMMADTNGVALKIKEVEVHQGSFHVDVGAAMTALQWAARDGHENIVQLLLNNNADANMMADTNGVALKIKEVEVYKGSFHANIDGNALMEIGGLQVHSGSVHMNVEGKISALQWALESRCEKVVELLLKSNVDANKMADTNGLAMPIKEIEVHKGSFHASFRGGVSMGIEALVVRHGSMHMDVEEGISALQWAASNNTKAMKKLIANDDIDWNWKDNGGQTLLSWVAGRGHDAVVELLLNRSSVIPDSKDNAGRTPLSWAAGCGRVAVVRLLINTNGVDPASKDNCGLTPLSWAAQNGHSNVVQVLLTKQSSSANSKDYFGRTPLLLAAEKGHDRIAELLLAYNSIGLEDEGQRTVTGLSEILQNEYKAVLQFLQGECDCSLYIEDGCVNTALSWAAEYGHDLVVKLLLAKNVNPESKDNDGRTPLSLAAQNGHKTVVEMLLSSAVVNPDGKDNYGSTALLLAAENGHTDVVQLLLANGEVNSDSANKYGDTPLSCAARNGYDEVVKLLIEKGRVNPSWRDKNGRTPLICAAEKGYDAVVELLMEAEVHSEAIQDAGYLDEKGSQGQTPLLRAAENGHEAVVRLLLATGNVDVNSKDRHGRTPLSRAAENGREAVVRLLLATGNVDVDSKDRYGRTPLSFATSEAVVRQLLDKGAAIEATTSMSRTVKDTPASNISNPLLKARIVNVSF